MLFLLVFIPCLAVTTLAGRPDELDLPAELIGVNFTVDRFCATLPTQYIVRKKLNLTDNMRHDVYLCLMKEHWVKNRLLYSPACRSLLEQSHNRPWQKFRTLDKAALIDCLFEYAFLVGFVSTLPLSNKTTYADLRALAVMVQYATDLVASTCGKNITRNRPLGWRTIGLNTSHYPEMLRCPSRFHKRYTLLDYFAWNNVTLPDDVIRLSELLPLL